MLKKRPKRNQCKPIWMLLMDLDLLNAKLVRLEKRGKGNTRKAAKLAAKVHNILVKVQLAAEEAQAAIADIYGDQLVDVDVE